MHGRNNSNLSKRGCTAGDLCKVHFFESITGAAQIIKLHLRILAGEDNSIGSAAEGGHDRSLGTCGCAFAVACSGGDVDVDARPKFGGEALERVAGSLGLAVDIV